MIGNRRWPVGSLRRAGIASFVALTVLAPSQGSAQALQSFEDLALRVNLSDRLLVADASGGRTTGRPTRLTAGEIEGQDREECADASIMAGALGASLGPAMGALMHKTTIVYPEPERRTFVVPAISRGVLSVRVSRTW